MCGIAGLLLPDAEPGRLPAAVRTVEAMNALQAHRGPDDAGVYDAPGIVLGHRRLSILDLSSRGHQPLQLADTPYWIVHNGEVYNYRELRTELTAQGFHFCSETDTEVILAAYAHWGTACVDRFNGMFAFAIWDARAHTVFCARDRFGIKPFHYVDLPDGTFAFASELKAFTALADFSPVVNDVVAAAFIGHGLVDTTNDTFLDGVHRLPAGHTMIRRAGETAAPRRYWDLREQCAAPRTIDNDAAVRAFREGLTDSVRLRLRSDVPVGTCLSGGLDSSTLVMAVHTLLDGQASGSQQATFSACFPDAGLDERPFMRQVAAAADIAPHEVYPTAAQLDAEVEDLVWHQDEPFGSTSIFAQRCVFAAARGAGVPVTLDGQGADEVLGGYDHYPPTYFLQLARAGRPVARWASAWRYARVRGMPVRRALRRARQRAAALTTSREPGVYLHPALRECARLPPLLADGDAGPFDLYREHLCRDLERALLPSLLRYADRNAMTFGVESRVPFLDHRVVELVYGFAADLLFRDGWPKWVLRAAFADRLPPAVAWRRDKLGFAPPEGRWFREAMGERFRALLATPSADVFTRYVDHATTQAAWQRFERGGPYRTDFWRVLNLELWLGRFVRGMGAAPGAVPVAG